MRALGIVFSNIHDNSIPELVAKRTFASIPFAGRYRLADFVLSNMVNSGIDTVGLITKRNYQSLMDHVGSGKDWDLSRKNGGLIILPPYGDPQEGQGLYTSRMGALKGITNFLNRADEEYVVLTDCDCVLRLDYNEVIQKHIKNKADITMVYRSHTGEEALIDDEIVLAVEENGRVSGIKYRSVEKAETKIFANIYIMKKNLLQKLIADSISGNQMHFTTGMLASNVKSLKIYGHEHTGYFAGIHSMQSYYEANLKLLDPAVRHSLFGDRDVYTKVRDSAPTKYGDNAVVKNSMIADGCVIEGEVINSVLFRGVTVGKGTVVKNSVLMQNTITGSNVVINSIITDKNVTITDKTVLSGSITHPFYISKGTRI